MLKDELWQEVVEVISVSDRVMEVVFGFGEDVPSRLCGYY